MFSPEKLPLIIQELSNIGQLLLTIAIFVATLIYVIFTKKMLDQNYSTFVFLMSLKRSGKNISANIENHGTEIALNVSIIVSSDKRKSIKTKLNGPRVLMEGEKVVYKGELSSDTDNSDILLTIRYQSHTRWPRKEFWKIKDDKIIFLGKKIFFKKYLYSNE
jgi:hypothetical protein